MLSDLKKYIQHISLSPDSIRNDDVSWPALSFLLLYHVTQAILLPRVTCAICSVFQAVSPLMKYLDDVLIILSNSLVKENLSR